MRNKWVLGLALLVLLTVFLTHVTIAQGVVPDANLAAEIRESLGLAPNSLLTPRNLRGLTAVFAVNSGITDLTGLEHATNLEVLALYAQQISDLKPLAKLTKLFWLDLRRNQISDLSPLAKLTKLGRLLLSYNKISDITPLTELTNLVELDLGDNEISDINPLVTLRILRELHLGNNEISDINPLATLRILKELHLGNNEISDINPLATLTNLQKLDLSGNEISDLSPLAKLTNLRALDLAYTEIIDLSPLAGLRQLEELQIKGSLIEDGTSLQKLLRNNPSLKVDSQPVPRLMPDGNLAELVRRRLSLDIGSPFTQQDLKRLTSLFAIDSGITDLTGLEHATNLRGLGLAYQQISDMTPLAKLTKLEILSLPGNEISDINPLAKLTNLKVLDLGRNEISDINSLAGLRQLEELDLGRNEISDLNPLAKLTQLKILSLRDNEISDLSPLAGLRQLEELQARGNPIADETSLQRLLRNNPNLKVDSQPVPRLMPDGNLASEVRAALSIDIGSPFTQQDLKRLTRLSASSSGITDITGLEHATQLKTLSLRDNEISDLSPLAKLTQLETLYLQDNEISDINPLAKLTQLKTLSLGDNEISDISPLAKLTQLETLYLQDNEISDISPLAKLTQLKTLTLNFNEISDLSSLTKLTRLEILFLEGNEISNTGPIRQLLQRNPNLKLDIHPDAGPKIEGPWVWMIAPIDQKSDGKAAASEKDWLKAASKGRVTEQQIAMNGALPGDIVGDKVWTLGKIALTDYNNITNTVNAIGWGTWDTLNNHVAYGSISLHSPRKQNTRIYVRSGEGVKVWLNGVLVHNNPVEPSVDNYRDVARVTLKQGKNILFVAVYHTSGSWHGFFGFKNDAVYSLSMTPIVHISAAQRPPMYWVATNAGTLHRLIGDEVEDMLPNVQNVTSLAVDPVVGSLYWTEKIGKRTGKMKRANLDGSNIKLIKDLTSVPLNIALDSAARKLYLINAYGKVQRLNLDGSNFQPNLITDLNSPKYLTIDVTGGKVYWIEQTGNTTGKIQRANLDGTNVELLKELTSVPHGLAIDPANNKLYLTNAYGKIQRLNLDGSNFQPNLITNLDAPQSLAIDSVGGKVYWIERGSLRRANRNGENIQNVVSGLGAPANIVLGSVPAATAAAPARVREIPTQTVLLANYPNPFNPETWIPYQLAEPSDVKITIYNTHGVVVRQLELGHQPAGTYTSQSRAAYWNGRNSQGERVASGIYFYQLQTDNVSSLRKMLILK